MLKGRTSSLIQQWLTVLLLLWSSLFAVTAMAVVETYEFRSETDRKRYQEFVDELRCPKCQNQNLSGSNSPIAQDLRRELYRMIEDGSTDSEIINFMVDRYGEFVLYRPRVTAYTVVLWLGPALLLLAGVISVLVIARKHRQQQVSSGSFSAAEQARLDALLGEGGSASFDSNTKADPKANSGSLNKETKDNAND